MHPKLQVYTYKTSHYNESHNIKLINFKKKKNEEEEEEKQQHLNIIILNGKETQLLHFNHNRW